MKYFISIILFSVITLKAQEGCKAVLSIETDNDLAFVIINSAEPVNGRSSVFELKPGTYVLTVGESSDRWDAKTFQDTITISSCDSLKRFYAFFSKALLDTEPQDAYVYTADTLLGHTPLILPSGIGDILLKKPGFEEVSLSGGNISAGGIIKLRPMVAQKNQSFFESPLFLYLSGSLLVFGAVTAYYKLEADDKYSEYQVTGNESLLKDTRRLDAVSGISFGLLQINFALLMYFFLAD